MDPQNTELFQNRYAYNFIEFVFFGSFFVLLTVPAMPQTISQWFVFSCRGWSNLLFCGSFVCVIDCTCNATDYILMICLSFIKSFISSELPIAPAHQLSSSTAFATKDSVNVKLRRKYIRDDGHWVGHTKKTFAQQASFIWFIDDGREAKKGEKWDIEISYNRLFKFSHYKEVYVA